MAIPAEDVARVRASVDIGALIGEYSALKKVGRRLVGLCPFHSENSPSFSVNSEEGLYYCFGCQASGDAISFLRAMDGLDFVEAVERLASRAGIEIRNDAELSAGQRVDRDKRQGLFDAVAAAVAFYHERLLSHKDASPARQYLRSRGYDGDIVRRFKIGWAPDAWDELAKGIGRYEGINQGVLKETGLAHVNSRGRLQDSFRGRVIFPIFDTSGKPIALGGRILPPELRAGGPDSNVGPKYRNSPESPIYSKRRTLYGLNWAKAALAKENEVVICEGYTDVIGMFTAGVPRAVATCGTALTEDHLRILGNFARRVVLAFDADNAGQSAAARIYESERRHGLEVSVASFPAGSDPGDLARTDPEALARSVKEAVPFLEFRIERAMAAVDMRTAEGRVRAAEAAVTAIAEHPNELVRDQYIVATADRTQIAPDRLRVLVDTERAGGGPRRPTERADHGGSPDRIAGSFDDGPPPRDEDEPQGQRQPSGRRGASPPGWLAGRDALALAVHRPRDMAAHLSPVLFADPLQRRVYKELLTSTSLHDAIDRADPDVADFLRQLAVTEPPEDVGGTLLVVALAAGEKATRDLERAARVAQSDGDVERLQAIAAETDWLKAALEELLSLGEASSTESADRLVAWLSERYGEVS
ncbi:MAG TPA: DNA primase [Acidimicrobiales bacterium]|nr:DNA primase [Acidimicrobiales bacterium]